MSSYSYGTRSQMSPTVIRQAESVVERVYLAVEHLCTALGDVRARLREAVMTLLPLQVREFPEHQYRDGSTGSGRTQRSMRVRRLPKGTSMPRCEESESRPGRRSPSASLNSIQICKYIRGFPLLQHRYSDD